MIDWTLDELLQQGESKELDFKGPMAWDCKGDKKKGCCDLAKDIIAMANTHGGKIVIGVKEAPPKNEILGLSDEQLKTWDTTRLNQFLAAYVSTPINTTMVKRTSQGGTCIVIDIPPFPTLPHICVKPFEGVLRRSSIYVRTDNNESAELTVVEDQTSLIERALRNQADILLRQVRSVLVGAQVVQRDDDINVFMAQLMDAEEWFDDLYSSRVVAGSGYFQMSCWPSSFNETRFTRDELRTSAWAGNLAYSDWLGLLTHSEANSPQNVHKAVEDSMEYGGMKGLFYGWRLYQSGLLFHRQVILDDVRVGSDSIWGAHLPGELIQVEQIGAFAAIAVDTANALYRSLGVIDEEITIRIEIIGAMDRKAIVPARWTMRDSGLRSSVDRIPAEQTLSFEEWIAGDVDHALTLANELLTLFNMRVSYRRDKIAETLASSRRP